MKPVFPVLLFALMLNLVGKPVHAQVRCSQAINTKLAELKVDKSTVKELYTTRYGTGEHGFQGYMAWIRLDTCRGHLVIDLTDACQVTSVYTTGTCQIPNVRSY